MHKFKFTLIALSICLILAMLAFPLAVDAASVNAAIIATSGQTITTINMGAPGTYDVGIYIGPGVKNVKVEGVTISGANYEGILVQDASNIVIQDCILSGNGLIVGGGETKAIVLAGTKNCEVKNNTVEGNLTGGISVLDDGSNQPFFVSGIATPGATAGTGNKVTGNLVKDNQLDCGIVVSGKNVAAGVSHNIVSNNIVIGFNPGAGDTNPGVGGIVVATGGAASTVTDTMILNNEVNGGFIAGISLHCSGTGVISGTQIIGNELSNNGGIFNTTGIEIAAEPTAVITKTQVLHDSVSNDYYGVWNNSVDTHIANLNTDSSVTTPIGPP
jgi:parallel beta-helix repeat protein